MTGLENLNFNAQRTRRDLLTMGAAVASGVAVALATTKGALAQNQNGQGQNGNQNGQGQNGGTRPAPAPLIGSGIPVGLAIGSILLGAKLFSAWRRQS